MVKWVVMGTEEAIPQEGSSNFMLDVKDKEMEKEGEKLVHCAVDCNIHFKTESAGIWVMERFRKFLES